MGIDVAEDNLNTHGTIVDSGTTSTYFPEDAKAPFLKAWKDWVGVDMDVTSRVGMSTTNVHSLGFTLTMEQLEKVPSILVQLEGEGNEHLDAESTPGLVGNKLDPNNPHDVLIVIRPTDYLLYDDSTGNFLTKIHFMEGTMNAILGANLMTGYDVVFDADDKKVGFAQSDCAYDKLVDDKTTY